MRHPTPEISDRIARNLASATRARREGDTETAWRLLEDAHVLSQPWPLPHLRVHGAMLVAAWTARDGRELRGQLLRLAVAGPASLVRRYPVGNPGVARVPADEPRPVRPDLAAMLTRAGERAG